MEGRDAEHYSYPLMGEVYKRRRYLTSYGKTQKTNFDGVVVDRNAEPDSYSGIVSISDGMITLGDNGEAVYEFSVPAAGNYDLAVKLGFPLWDKNSVRLSLDGTSFLVEEHRLWWPLLEDDLLERGMEGGLSICRNTYAYRIGCRQGRAVLRL
jgi:hypothetical protein